MNKEEVDKFCKEYYGYTIEEVDVSIGYWMGKYYELEQENNQLKEQVECLIKQRDDINKNATEHLEKNIDYTHIVKKLRSWLEDWIENEEYCYLASNVVDRCRQEVYREVLDKLNELEGGKNDKN